MCGRVYLTRPRENIDAKSTGLAPGDVVAVTRIDRLARSSSVGISTIRRVTRSA